MARLVAVLGYSTRRGEGLHVICTARLETAERVAEGAEAVLLSGWSRRRHRPSEAELMRQAWRGPEVTLLADGDARTTAGNARAVAAVAKEVGANEVVVVTSSWHARRARLLVRAALGPNVMLEVVTPARTRPPHLVGRELVCLLPACVYLAFDRIRRGNETPEINRRSGMVTKGLLVRLKAKPGKESDVESFLAGGLSLVEAEPDTTAWFAIRFGDSEFGIFDVFPGETGRQAHLTGEVAKALFAQADDLLSEPPGIEQIDVIAAKLPG